MAIEVISGTHKTGKGNWDGMHKFGSGDSTWANLHGWIQFGSIGSGKIPKALQEFYKKYNLNPCITAVKFTVDPVNYKVDYEFTIEESPDGNAYVGFSSWGGASGGYPKKLSPASHAYPNYKKEYDAAISKIKDTKVAHVIDLYFPGGFRQIFFQHTWPKKYPNLPKSPNAKTGIVGVTIGPSGSPKDLPLYNGVLVNTTSISPTTEGTTTPAPDNVTTNSTISGSASTTPTPATPTGNKIKLVKKSGPGELMGEVEKEAYNGEVSFEGLQFDQPGDYVITAVPDTNEFESIDFKITVKQGEEKPQDPKKDDEPKKDGNRPVIAQIDKPTIKLKPIQIDVDNGQQTLEYAKGVGILPFIWYKSYQIQEREISSLGLYHDGIVPCCSFTFEDTLGIMNKDGMPLDNDYFELFFNSGSDFIKSIHMRFKIISFQENKNKTYTITGSIDLPDFYKINFKAYTGTSFDVLRDISKELQLGFNSNINSADDSMKWRNSGKRFKEFISEIVNHSYISDNSFLMGYIDFYYCFNYVDVEKEWIRDISNDVSIESRGIGQMSDSEEEDKIVPLVLKSDKSVGPTNLFFTNHKVTNNSTKNSVNNGQFTISKFYDSNTKSFLIFDVNSLTSKDDTKVILKGEKTDKTDLETNFRTDFKGRIDTSNVHKNYLYATVQNKTNYQNLTRIQVEFEMPNANFILYKFQKVKLDFIKDSEKLSDESLNTQRLTGEWIIINIEYMWSRGKMKQKILAVRKELEKIPSELENQTTDQKPETKQGESNEEIPADPPNSKFTPNETYTVQAADGKIYTVIVTQLLENGTEISGYVQEK